MLVYQRVPQKLGPIGVISPTKSRNQTIMYVVVEPCLFGPMGPNKHF